MSKSTETTNDRVPRVLVRFGKHPSSVGNTHRVWETPIKRIETPIKRIETPIECGKRPSSVGKRGGAPRRCRGVRDSRNEGTRGVGGAIGRIVGRCRG